MILFIAEKPSVMKNIIDANLEGYKPKIYKGYAVGKNMIYTHCIGHLLTLKMPKDIDLKYKVWDINTLPFRFDNIPLVINESVKEQFNIVDNLIKRNDILEIVNACDSDREGDLIFRNLYHYTKSNCKNVSRMWIESQTVEGIKESFMTRRNEKDYNNIYFAGKSRSYADYIIGLNSTMGMTSKFKNTKEIYTIGRVQTPTLRIIVDLEREINNFISKPYFKITADGIVNDVSLVGNYINKDLDNNRFFSKDDALKMIDKIGIGDAVITKAESNKRYEKPKLLYSLSDLQIDMDKRYGMSPIDVLNTAQALYETHKLITYPRTDENHISEALAKRGLSIVKSLAISNSSKDLILKNNYRINPIMIAKKDIGAHEALTPTGLVVSKEKIESLKPNELKVYMAIVERFLAAFLEDAVIEKQKLVFVKNNEVFNTEIEVCTKEGHRAAYQFGKKEKSESKSFISAKEGDIVCINKLNLVEGKTTPPQRFTEGSLIKMMKNPIKYVSDNSDKDVLKRVEGIGTEATRANIIVELKKRGLIDLDKKKYIFPTKKGIGLIDTIPSETIKSVSLTAMFERKLDLIAKGEYNHLDFLNEINELEANFINDLKNIDEFSSSLMKVVCKCPVCNGTIYEKEKGYFCNNNDVFILKNALNAKLITLSQAKSLFLEGETKTKVLCRSKNNTDFESIMKYHYDKDKKYPNVLEFDFNKEGESEPETIHLKEEAKPICKCPMCSASIIEGSNSYYCSNRNCRVKVYKNVRGCKKISKKAVIELLTKGITSTKMKFNNNGSEIECYLKYEYVEELEYPNVFEYVGD